MRVTLGKLFDWLGGWGWTAGAEDEVHHLTNGQHVDGTADVVNEHANGHVDDTHTVVVEEPKRDVEVNGHNTDDTVNTTDVNIVESNSRSAEQ